MRILLSLLCALCFIVFFYVHLGHSAPLLEKTRIEVRKNSQGATLFVSVKKHRDIKENIVVTDRRQSLCSW